MELNRTRSGGCTTRSWPGRFSTNEWHAQAQLERVLPGHGTHPDQHGQTSLAVPPGSTATFLSYTTTRGRGAFFLDNARAGPVSSRFNNVGE